MNIASFAPLAVVLPILGAALTFLLIRHSRAQRTVSIALLSLTLLLECLLLASVWDGGTAAVNIGGWLPPWGIVMVVDQFSSLMLVVSSSVSLAVLIYATGQGMADGDQDAPVSIFHPTYLILVAGVSNTFLSGDLFNLYVGFEILLTASYVLMTLGGTGPRIRAGVTYVVVSVVSSVLFLIAIAMIYGATGTINMADLALKLAELDPGTRNLLPWLPRGAVPARGQLSRRWAAGGHVGHPSRGRGAACPAGGAPGCRLRLPALPAGAGRTWHGRRDRHAGVSAPIQAGRRWPMERTHAWGNQSGKLRWYRTPKAGGRVLAGAGQRRRRVGRLVRRAWTCYRWEPAPPAR